MGKLIRIESEKNIKDVVAEIKEKAKDYDFVVRAAFNMGNEFKHHSVDVSDEFDLVSIMLCNPQKAYLSLVKSPIRGAYLLPPKQVVVFSDNGKTILSYVQVERKDVAELYPEDELFQRGLTESSQKIVQFITAVA